MSKTITPSQLEPLIEAAILAPSSHNTQPWIFKLSNNCVSLVADRTRALPVNDPDDRELVISCGAALLNLRIAAAHGGINATVATFPNSDDSDLLAKIDLVESSEISEPGAQDLYSAIPKRRTYRKQFLAQQIPNAALSDLVSAAEREGTWLRFLQDRDMRHGTADLIAEGDAIQWANPSWRRELATWLRPRQRGDGLTVPGLVAPLARAAVRTFNMGNRVGAKDHQLAEGSPVLAVLGTPGDGPADWLGAGQALQRLLLSGFESRLQASFLNQPIQVASLRPKLQHLVGGTGFPQILLRIGYHREMLKPAPRRAVSEVIAAQ